jgi:hypothetical protein
LTRAARASKFIFVRKVFLRRALCLMVSCAAHRAEAGEPAADPPACRIAEPRASLSVEITAGTRTFQQEVRGASVIIVPRDADWSAVQVLGALELAGRTKGLRFFPATPIVVAGGVVRLGPRSELRKASPSGTALVAETVDVGPGFELGPVTVPCAALSFVGARDQPDHARPELRQASCEGPCLRYTTPETLDFHATPGAASPVRLTGSTIVSALERSGPWTRVSTQDFVHMDGAQLTGWVLHSRLRRLSGAIGFTGGRGGLPGRLGDIPSIHYAGPGIRQGPAHVDAGTLVYSSPSGGTTWATVRDRTATFEIAARAGEDRAQVLSAPFLPSLTDAWVPLSAAHFVEDGPR